MSKLVRLVKCMTMRAPHLSLHYIGDHNILTGTVVESKENRLTIQGEDGHCFALPGEANPVGSTVTFSVRADHAYLVDHSDQATAATNRNILCGVATVVEYAGYIVRITLETEARDEFSVYVPEKRFSQTPVQLNQKIKVGWQAEDAICLNV